MRGSQQSGGCANNLEEDAAVMPSGTGLEVRIDGLREQEARRMHGRKAVDQVLCETGGGGGGDERGAEKEQAGRVVSRGGRGGGEESQAHLQRRLVRGRLEQGRRQRRRRAEEGDAAFCEAFCEEIGLLRLLPF